MSISPVSTTGSDLRTVARAQLPRAAAALALLVGFSIGIGFAAGGGGFDWSVWALVLTALGTLALAAATGVLAASTWQDVRASQLVAHAAQEANELVRKEQERRPQLTLQADDNKIHSHVELGGLLWVRLLVENAIGLRAAIGARVLVDRCISAGGDVITFGSPALGWTSAGAPNNPDEAVVIFSGATRVLDLGQFVKRATVPDSYGSLTVAPDAPWELRILLPRVGDLGDLRTWVDTGTTIRLVVGAEDSDARTYDVLVGWQTTATDVDALLGSLSVIVKPVG